ncbi:hypothetical protein HanRHA438_Chr14g0650901 [Helianthus annuus]|uniref:Uncharacterized protein n=1 Tax=Helianthus annuus TaxID=4232 RepID=A0A9K3H605_HELAN|nr:hypothetical protein HanXRQr2_Chr14g0640511 [Helianthus annuus]KAJ0463941.1 hypothetical protein HanHA300_Chr14g0521401 [Helianthus annuus]KAJ0468292.1 hypothetical protein HanIR_Chr14g0694981 [Helianthus annuus]KAJ0485446.1 hypothetical protein HanHA89_Chr14g0568421 [Helianthus annuus]KAJ0655999.1 hypothetical protein HanLR1_Chr14g0530811 [Helianthus annuus]
MKYVVYHATVIAAEGVEAYQTLTGTHLLMLKRCLAWWRHGSKDVRKLCFGMLYGTFWFISKARNKLVFKKLRPSIKNTVKKIIAHLFSWVKNKSKHHSLSWQSRMICPDCCLFVRG